MYKNNQRNDNEPNVDATESTIDAALHITQLNRLQCPETKVTNIQLTKIFYIYVPES